MFVNHPQHDKSNGSPWFGKKEHWKKGLKWKLKGTFSTKVIYNAITWIQIKSCIHFLVLLFNQKPLSNTPANVKVSKLHVKCLWKLDSEMAICDFLTNVGISLSRKKLTVLPTVRLILHRSKSEPINIRQCHWLILSTLMTLVVFMISFYFLRRFNFFFVCFSSECLCVMAFILLILPERKVNCSATFMCVFVYTHEAQPFG